MLALPYAGFPSSSSSPSASLASSSPAVPLFWYSAYACVIRVMRADSDVSVVSSVRFGFLAGA
jgi:hypothetical protein